MKQNNGFTLLEVMVVVAILSIIAALTMPDMRGYVANTKTKSTSRQIYNMMQSARILAAKEGEDVIVAFGDPTNTTATSFTEVLMGFDRGAVPDGVLTKVNASGVAEDLIVESVRLKTPVEAVRDAAAIGQIIFNPRGFLESSAGGVTFKNSETSRRCKVSVSAVGVVTFKVAG